MQSAICSGINIYMYTCMCVDLHYIYYIYYIYYIILYVAYIIYSCINDSLAIALASA